MFAGHLAAGLALKKVDRKINLGWLFFAALFHDFLLGILVLLGIEQIIIPVDFAQKHYLSFIFPYSHSLVASVIWSLLAFGITYAVLPRWTSRERVRAGLALSLAVFSHFVFDWIVHVPDLPLWSDASPKIGLGLWNNLPLALILEVALVVVGFVFYLVTVKPKSNLNRYGLGILLLVVSSMTVMGQLLAETPPPATGAAMSWIFQPFLICGLAFWFDKKA